MRIELPIAMLPPGEICPPMAPDHPSWSVLESWDDPLAPLGGFLLAPGKTRVECDGRAAIEFGEGRDLERALVTGGSDWREFTVECRTQALQEEAGPTNDDWQASRARCGLIFRAETMRRMYWLCLEGRERLVLYRRLDQEWLPLAEAPVDYAGQEITLRVALDADGMVASCPELGVEVHATDATIAGGYVGYRSLGASRLLALTIETTASQEAVNERRTAARRRILDAHRELVPAPVQVGELTPPPGYRLVEAAPLRSGGQHDLLLSGPEGLLAKSWDGRELWRFPGPVGLTKLSAGPVDGGRRLHVLCGEMRSAPQTTVRGDPLEWRIATHVAVLDAATGRELARRELPADPEREHLRQYDFSHETGRLSGDEPADVIVRSWHSKLGGGGRDLWAFDGDLELLWHTQVDPPYGHHWSVHLVDLDGDGRDEVVAGGTTLDARGEVVAIHDRAQEMAEIRGAHHYDAVAAGMLAGDPERDPVAFLVSGSAGVYVIDPLTGRTRAVHRVGHAQGRQLCRLRDDLPGTQVMVSTRWGNMGILTLFSGLGDRLWTIQPSFIPAANPVQWLAEGPQHLWVNSTCAALGLYDGYGRCVSELPAVRAAWGDHPPNEVRASVLQRAADGPELLALTIADRVMLFGAER